MSMSLNSLKDPSNIGNVLSGLMGLVPFERLKEAVMHQMDAKGELALGVVLITMGLLTQSDLDWALKIQEELRAGRELQAKILVMEYQSSRLNKSLDKQHADVDRALESSEAWVGDIPNH